MSPEAILSALTKTRRELHVEKRADGYSFWLGPKAAGASGSNRVIRVSRTSVTGATKLKRAATALAFPDVQAEEFFTGGLDELHGIVDAEIAVVRSRLQQA